MTLFFTLMHINVLFKRFIINKITTNAIELFGLRATEAVRTVALKHH